MKDYPRLFAVVRMCVAAIVAGIVGVCGVVGATAAATWPPDWSLDADRMVQAGEARPVRALGLVAGLAFIARGLQHARWSAGGYGHGVYFQPL